MQSTSKDNPKFTKKEILQKLSDQRANFEGISGQALFDRRPQFFAGLKIKPSDLQNALEGRTNKDGITTTPSEKLQPKVEEFAITESEAQRLWDRLKKSNTDFAKNLLARMVKGPIKITKSSHSKRQKGIDSLNRGLSLLREAIAGVKDRVFNQVYGKLFEPEIASKIHEAMFDNTDSRPLNEKIASITALPMEDATKLANAWQDALDKELAEEQRRITSLFRT